MSKRRPSRGGGVIDAIVEAVMESRGEYYNIMQHATCKVGNIIASQVYG